jgi:predicted XRE-type DNA-binding protein
VKSKNPKDKPDYEIGSSNVHADLGRAAPSNLLVKAQLVSRISEILEERGLTQVKAAALLGITQPKLSSMLRGQFRGLSERKLMDCLTRLGQDVQINVRHARCTGTDVAIQSAGITLVKGDLTGIVRARGLSRAVMRNIRKNLWLAFVCSVLGIPIAAVALWG